MKAIRLKYNDEEKLLALPSGNIQIHITNKSGELRLLATGISGDDVYYSWLATDLSMSDMVEIDCVEAESEKISPAEQVIEKFSKGYPDEYLLQEYYRLKKSIK
ncbi:MAG: hypothetical protein IJY36_05005 [Coprobacter sp.]|nr:hypothetical protein [Coprobacter sp.]